MTKTGGQLSDISSFHQELCRELNMDKDTEKQSWNTYQEISEHYVLEGDASHWLCCAIYAACRESYTPTVGNSNTVVRGNCVSLTKLLRSSNISTNEFFSKIKRWLEMTNLSQNFRREIDRLERSFGVSYVLYNKYAEIFDKLFIIPPNEKKIKKSRPGKCPPSKLYDFCWCLFLCAKGEEPKHTVDLVTSFHLLLCCIDLVFANALAENRKDIINPSFQGLPAKYNSSEFNPNESVPYCIMSSLCQLQDVAFVEAMKMKSYSFKVILKSFLKQKTLIGNENEFLEIISNVNFEPNLKSLNNVYEQYVLSVGEFDERMFLNSKKGTTGTVETSDDMTRQSQESIRSLVPETPLTRRNYLPSKDVSEPVASAAQNVKQLYNIADREMPLEFFRRCGDDVVDKLEERLTNMCTIFCNKYPSTNTEPQERFKLAKALYYHLAERILRAELKKKPHLDLKKLLDLDIFNTSLIACSVEIVIVAYNSEIKFPWILECFDLSALNFSKIIESVVLNHEDILTRDLIKELNRIEEKCLDSLVWASNSQLWTVINQWQKDDGLPKWEHVDNHNTLHLHMITQNRKFDGSNTERNILQSPTNSTLECFNQPQSTPDSARRDLFNVGKAENNTSSESVQSVNADLLKRRVGSNSTVIFFRKFYKLAYMRILELCKNLNINSDEYLNPIWNLFEYSITQRTELMQDRHLDQILMCAIYVFIKVKDMPKTFTDIMKFYRTQPQATSEIYRNVLKKPANPKTNSPHVYGDIIQFYNEVYVKSMSPYALNFGDQTMSQKNLLLSPHPPEKQMTPRKISINHNLYIEPLIKDIPESPNPLTYEFYRSPAKDLKYINDVVNGKFGKRVLPFDDEGSPQRKQKLQQSQIRCIERKIHGIMRDRQSEEINE